MVLLAGRVKSMLRRRKHVAVFGAGPAGLFAAKGILDAGHIVTIWSNPEKSKLFGAQYLHAPIPGLGNDARQTVTYRLEGTADGYRAKVYGNDPAFEGIEVSPKTLAAQHDAWDIRSAYEDAWSLMSGWILPTRITPHWLDTHGRMMGVDGIVWTIPLAPQCVKNHKFVSTEVWAQGDAPELNRYCVVNVPPFTVVTNGEEAPSWYRAANVFGYKTAEWPGGTRPPVQGIARVSKPVSTDCDCWDYLGGSPVLRVGRYGTWTKGELSHQAYERALEFVRGL